jgi:glycoside/pentoside/hexuronide:cation symporter, GPH family
MQDRACDNLPVNQGDGQASFSIDRIPLKSKLVFALGSNTENMSVGLLMGALWMPFFNIGLGMSPAVLGLILMVFRAWDAFSDPFIGNLSDNLDSRWGRRKPFMLFSIVLAGAIFPFFWFMPELGNAGQVAYLLIVGLLFFTAMTGWTMPYNAMLMEMTANYDERTRLTMWTSIGTKISIFASGWVMALVTSQWFANPETGEADIVRGLQSTCWLLAAVFVVTGLLPVSFVRERFHGQVKTARAKESFWKSVQDSYHLKPLWALIAVSFFLMLGMTSAAAVWQYVNIYYMFAGDIAAASVFAGWKSSIMMGIALASVPVVTWFAERFDKMPVMIVMLFLMIGGHLLNVVLMIPGMPFLHLIAASAEAAGISGFWILLSSMKADVADFDERATGRRREGSVNAFYSWFIKLGATLALGMSGFILQMTGFDAKLPSQSESVITSMRNYFIYLPVVLWAISLVFAFRYTLNRKQMVAIRAELEARRGVV